MRTVLLALALTAAVAFAACGDDDDGGGTPVAEGPTTLTIDKAFASDGDVFTFTLQVVNSGENAAVLVALSDVWEEGITLESIGDFDGEIANAFPNDRGFEVLVDEFDAGTTRDITYRARCVQSGQWTNTATVSAQNAEPVTTSVSLSCR